MNITVCGGGNEGHVIAGYLAAHKDNKVSLLTRQPQKWAQTLEIFDNEGREYIGKLDKLSNVPYEVIPMADIVIVCVPGFAIHDVLTGIAPYLNKKTWVGTVVASTGFFFEAFELLPKEQTLFGFQRVPFISRIIEYGHMAELKGYKKSLGIAVEQTEDKEIIRQVIEGLFGSPTILLDSYYDVALSNSNPLLHTARLYSLWKEWKLGISYEVRPQFYTDWSDSCSELLIKMDEEFQILLRGIGVKPDSIPTLLDYYECYDANSLTRKLSSIDAFKGMLAPMVKNNKGQFEPDISSRYFQEDIPYGMRFIIEMADKYNVDIPQIRKVYEWGTSIINNNIAKNNESN
jgi:hypothetical protein